MCKKIVVGFFVCRSWKGRESSKGIKNAHMKPFLLHRFKRRISHYPLKRSCNDVRTKHRTQADARRWHKCNTKPPLSNYRRWAKLATSSGGERKCMRASKHDCNQNTGQDLDFWLPLVSFSYSPPFSFSFLVSVALRVTPQFMTHQHMQKCCMWVRERLCESLKTLVVWCALNRGCLKAH